MQLHHEWIALSFDRDPADGAFDAAHDGLRREHATRPMTHRACFGHVLQMTLANALPRHLDEAEVTDLERFGSRAVPTKMRAEVLQHFVAISLRFHVDEIRDDDPSDVAESQLTRDFASRLEIGAQDRFFRILLARVPTRVH